MPLFLSTMSNVQLVVRDIQSKVLHLPNTGRRMASSCGAPPQVPCSDTHATLCAVHDWSERRWQD